MVGVRVGWATTTMKPETGRPVNAAGWPPLLALFPDIPLIDIW